MEREMKKRIFSVSLVSMMLISFLASCTSNTENKTSSLDTKNQISSEKLDKLKEWYSSKNMSSISSNDSDSWKLKVSSRCIWCGKCVHIAPNNFAMNWNIAEPISQEDLSSSDLSRAISHCPVWAISIG